MSPKLGIQTQQNPAIPRNPCNCLQVVGTVILANVFL